MRVDCICIHPQIDLDLILPNELVNALNPIKRAAEKRGWSIPAAALILFAVVTAFFPLLLEEDFPASNPEGAVSTLRIGILPDENAETLRRQFEPMLEYLSSSLQIRCELVIPDTYGQLVELFHRGEVDLAYFGGYSFVKASEQDRALPIVMRRIDTRFTSYLLVPGSSDARELQDLRNKRLGFGSPLSTSGHLMPRHFFTQMGIEPEKFFAEVYYSGAHDKTVYWVRDGKVDLGAVNASTVRKMLESGLIESDEVRVLWETPPYADYVWAVQSNLDRDLVASIRSAYLELSPDIDAHRAILTNLGASGYIIADPEYFSDLETIVRQFEGIDASRRAGQN